MKIYYKFYRIFEPIAVHFDPKRICVKSKRLLSKIKRLALFLGGNCFVRVTKQRSDNETSVSERASFIE